MKKRQLLGIGLSYLFVALCSMQTSRFQLSVGSTKVSRYIDRLFSYLPTRTSRTIAISTSRDFSLEMTEIFIFICGANRSQVLPLPIEGLA